VKFLDTEHIRLATLHLHEKGRELTPDQLRDIARGAFDSFRKSMREQGFDVPDDDEALFRMMRNKFRS
jgi:hypothetical protein